MDTLDFGSSQFSRIRPNPTPTKFPAGFCRIPASHNGFGVEMLIFLKHNSHLLNLGLKSEELNDDCDVNYSTFSTSRLLVCFCDWQISNAGVHNLV